MVDQPKVAELLEALEAEVPKGGGQVRLATYGEAPDESYVVANEAGLLRLGLALMKAAYEPEGSNRQIVLDLDDLVTPDSDIYLRWVERRDDVAAVERRQSWKDRGLAYAGVVLALAAVLLVGIGLVTVVSWIT